MSQIIQLDRHICDDLVEAACKVVVDHIGVDKEKLRQHMPVDFPYNEWFQKFGIVVRYGRPESQKAGFVMLEFITKDDIHVERFELELRKAVTGGRNYINDRFATLHEGIMEMRKQRMEQAPFEIVDRPVVVPPNGHDILAEAVHHASNDSRH